MDRSFSKCLDILSAAEASLAQRPLDSSKLLGANAPLSGLHTAVESHRHMPRIREHDALFNRVEETYLDIRKGSSIDFRPFEIFWWNPYEPQHTALLKYFIDPSEGHGSGESLLRQFLWHLGLRHLAVDGCSVTAEEGVLHLGEAGRIDILITREASDHRYAVVVENKVRGASDTKSQLSKYVLALVDDRKFSFDQIYVRYLPLRKGTQPGDDSIRKLRGRLGERFEAWWSENCRVTSFEEHILPWLEEAAESTTGGMRGNLNHYRDLIRFLVQTDKARQMQTDILKHLEAEKGSLPQFEDVLALQEYTNQLVRCFHSIGRGKLLLKLQRDFGPENAWLRVASDPDNRADISSPYDPRFLESTNVCVAAGPSVAVCFGGNPDTVWCGYLKTGGSEGQKTIEPIVLERAETCLENRVTGDPHWYAYQQWPESDYDATYHYATKQLRDMRNELIARLPNHQGSTSNVALPH